MVSQATEVRDFLFANWSLTGELSKTPSETMQEIVNFYDRLQVKGNEMSKAITVEKINDEQQENQIENPNYIEVRDYYEITLNLRVTDVGEDEYSQALAEVEEMATETLRILNLLFSPSMSNGIFWVVDRDWTKHDFLEQAEPQLVRKLRLSMSMITSFDGKLFSGYSGLIYFESTSGHLYAEIQNVNNGAGFPQISEPIAGTSLPLYFTGTLEGQWSADMYVSRDDIGSDDFDINQIGNVKSNEEVTEATFLQLYDDTENPVQRMTITTKVKIETSVYVGNVQDLVKYNMTGEIIEYPVVTVAPAP